MAESLERGFVEVNGLRTFYAKAGSGEAALMIHGGSPGACSMLNWKPNIGPIADAGFTVYAFDQPGFGETEIPSDHSMEFRVAHALAFVEEIGLERVHLVGNSMGAYIAARIALASAAATGRLVLASSTTLAPKGSEAAQAIANKHSAELGAYEPGLENMRQLSEGTFYDRNLVTEEFVQQRYEMSTGAHFDAMLARQKAAGATPLQDRLGEITQETLILWGANDRGAAVERALLLFDALPNAELHVFSRCAHWVHWDQANRFNRMVADFLAKPG